ncbi:hypothetical protein I7I50_03988 [Histoplasma capsulatum G186AR]|uniref:Uncharacterized protein n=1 Tax=Ajellomyces capsulatus TaxID=5037 RepID=A0A8H7YJJ7_AJECA|nr:hypothetical protein I7I52_04896 [Histoplasma capsulatum]QSS74996.1 hypothetical protein I7I50_03988 [Histoplasma capsulatum G186AR]
MISWVDFRRRSDVQVFMSNVAVVMVMVVDRAKKEKRKKKKHRDGSTATDIILHTHTHVRGILSPVIINELVAPNDFAILNR